MAAAPLRVAVVGAGYTGLWTAYHLVTADPTIRVAVIEKEVAGFGASASDLVLPDEVNTLLIARLDRLAADVKETVQAASALAVGLLAAILPSIRAARVRIVDGLRYIG